MVPDLDTYNQEFASDATPLRLTFIPFDRVKGVIRVFNSTSPGEITDLGYVLEGTTSDGQYLYGNGKPLVVEIDTPETFHERYGFKISNLGITVAGYKDGRSRSNYPYFGLINLLGDRVVIPEKPKYAA
jgi:hypothetical protein